MKSAGPSDLDKYLEQNDETNSGGAFRVPADSECQRRSEHNADMARAADMGLPLSRENRNAGSRITQLAGHPIVVGEWRGAPGAPTVLVYGHYDVQPAEPLDLWTSPPFEPTVRDGKILRARIRRRQRPALSSRKSARSAPRDTRGKLPLNVVLIAEGEEEVGSATSSKFISENQDLLKV